MENSIDTLSMFWILIAAFLVFIMQAGFAMLETGLVRAKNSVNIAIKNVIDFLIAIIVFYAVGFGFMFGNDSFAGILSLDGFFLDGFTSPYGITLFIFQLMFAGTAATIVSGAVAERMSFKGYAFVSAVITAMIYPMSGHWIWNEHGWLKELGFLDFAGSTVVHSLGAWIGLVGTVMIGARYGRFDMKNSEGIPHFNLTLATLGVFLLWFGWFGFNGGSTLEANDKVPQILLNTILASAGGGVATFVFLMLFTEYVSVPKVLNGVLGGLVAITAGCAYVEPMSALLIGILSSIIVYNGDKLLIKLKIDDPVGAIPVHGFAGVFGSIIFVLFMPKELLHNNSIIDQLLVQSLGVFVVFLWASITAYFMFLFLKKQGLLRVTLEDELIGLNISEHGMKMTWVDTVNTTKEIIGKGDYTKRIDFEEQTEAGEVAEYFNILLDDLQEKIFILDDVSRGNFDIQPISPKSEKDILTISLNNMTANLREMMEKIQKNQEDLELRVENRTVELAKTNETLNDAIKNLKETQDQLIEAEKMSSLSQLVAGVSHEINTPVGNAVTAASSLQERKNDFREIYITGKMKRFDLDEFLEFLEEGTSIILSNLDRAHNLIQSFKKVSVDQNLEIKEDINIRDYFENIRLSIIPSLRKRNIQLLFNCENNITIKSYPGLFSQVVTNLAMNALTHAYEDKESGVITVSFFKNEHNITMQFSDDGKGIPEEIIEKIFDPFFTTKRGSGGSGLGLHIIYNIITKQLGGTIKCFSEVGIGTTFEITIPEEAN